MSKSKKSSKLMVHQYVPSHPKYSSRVYQNAYFNSSKTLSNQEREELATKAYEQSLQKK